MWEATYNLQNQVYSQTKTNNAMIWWNVALTISVLFIILKNRVSLFSTFPLASAAHLDYQELEIISWTFSMIAASLVLGMLIYHIYRLCKRRRERKHIKKMSRREVLLAMGRIKEIYDKTQQEAAEMESRIQMETKDKEEPTSDEDHSEEEIDVEENKIEKHKVSLLGDRCKVLIYKAKKNEDMGLDMGACTGNVTGSMCDSGHTSSRVTSLAGKNL